MADPDILSVLQRKAGAGQPSSDIPRLSATGALSSALRRAGQDVANVSIAVRSVEDGKAVLDDVLDNLLEHALVCLIEGPESSFGMAVLDRKLMAGLVEAQTIGNVSSAAVADRTPTRTDAAICADFVDRMLECFEVEAHGAKLDIIPHVSGYRYALPIMDHQVISLTLENVLYRTFRADLDLAGGAKQGVLTLILPCEVAVNSKQSQGGDGDAPDHTIVDVALTCRAELRAILHQVHLPVADVAKFEVGMVIPIPLQAMAQVELLDSEDGVVTACRLGQVQGQRALRIGTTSDQHTTPMLQEHGATGSVAASNDTTPSPLVQADAKAS